MRPLYLLVTAIVLGCSPTLRGSANDYIYDKDVQTLLRTAYFGFGLVGASPRGITEGEGALRRIMKSDEAMKFLMPVFEHGTPEGKCYALIGFRLLSPSYFESSCKRVSQWNNSKIKSFSGCIILDLTLRDVVQAIREGRYDDEVLGGKTE